MKLLAEDRHCPVVGQGVAVPVGWVEHHKETSHTEPGGGSVVEPERMDSEVAAGRPRAVVPCLGAAVVGFVAVGPEPEHTGWKAGLPRGGCCMATRSSALHYP
jgi:hypothetical protein